MSSPFLTYVNCRPSYVARSVLRLNSYEGGGQVPSFSEWMFWSSSSGVEKMLDIIPTLWILSFVVAASRWWMDLLLSTNLFCSRLCVVDCGPPRSNQDRWISARSTTSLFRSRTSHHSIKPQQTEQSRPKLGKRIHHVLFRGIGRTTVHETNWSKDFVRLE